MLTLATAFAVGLLVGVLSAVAGIGGGVLMVPFLYAMYAGTGVSHSAQTVVAHATSLGVAFVTSSLGTVRYARAGAIAWRAALSIAIPGILTAFVVARLLARAEQADWLRAVFGIFLLFAAWDLSRRARHHQLGEHGAPHRHSHKWLGVIGVVNGSVSALLGIGGGLISVPALFYVGRLPIANVAPTALAAVCLTTLSGAVSFLTAGPAPAVSESMAGFLDLRMALPLALGAAATVPLGVRFNRRSSPPTLYWAFTLIFGVLGIHLVYSWLSGRAG